MIWSLNLLNVVQALIVFVGVASGLVLCGGKSIIYLGGQ